MGDPLNDRLPPRRRKAPPLMVECEGTGSFADDGYCQMCGLAGDALPITRAEGFLLVDTHQRQDIIAMIERGDFDS